MPGSPPRLRPSVSIQSTRSSTSRVLSAERGADLEGSDAELNHILDELARFGRAEVTLELVAIVQLLLSELAARTHRVRHRPQPRSTSIC